MSSDGLDRLYSAETTRRSIIRMGTKIAYSAPLIAASISLGGRGAAAIPAVSPTCTPDGVGCTSTAECCEGFFCQCGIPHVCVQYGVLGSTACCTESRQCIDPLICGSNNQCCDPNFPGQPGGCPI